LYKSLKFKSILKNYLHKLTAIIGFAVFFLASDGLLAQSPPDSVETISVPKKSSTIETTINYNADDSIRFEVRKQLAHLYGQAHVDYGDISLDAEYIQINWKKKEVLATYRLDSNGNKVGTAKFKDKDAEYSVDTVKYNWGTKKGYITDLISRQSGGYLVTKRAVKDSSNILYAQDAYFCPCLDSTAGTYIKSKKIKVIPNKRVYTGPFLLYIEDIPLPLGGPFGMFPIANKRSSGIIIPQYGEQQDRGFNLKNGGFYWAVNDYIGAKFLGEIYSKGGWGGSLITNYKKRYKFDGNFSFNYRNVVQLGDETQRSEINDYKLRWRHSPSSRGGKKFSAEVNFATTTYNQNNERNFNNYLQNTLRSNIRYSFPIKKLLNVNLLLRHSQNNQTKVVNLSLPEVSVGLKNRLYPFRIKNITRSDNPLKNMIQSINLNYTMNTQNKINNSRINYNLPFNLSNYNDLDTAFLAFDNTPIDEIIARSQYGVKHFIPIRGNLKLGSLNIEGSGNYNEYWLPKRWNYKTTSDTTVSLISDNGFHRAYDYNMNLSLTTRLYGKFISKKMIEGNNKWAVRQTISPRLSYDYSPDFSAKGDNNNFQEVIVGNRQYNVSRYHSLAYNPSSLGLSQTVGFDLTSVVEMKRYSLKDTVSKAKYIKLLENVSGGTSYNFAKDSINLSDIRLLASTKLLNFIGLRMNSSFHPYVREKDTNGRVVSVNKFRWKDTKEPVYMDRMTFTLSTSLNPNVFKKLKNKDIPSQEEEAVIRRLERENPDFRYVNYDIPWSLGLSYSYKINRLELRDNSEESLRETQSFSLRGDLSLTKKWKIDGRMSYDFVNKKFIYPNINIHRDLNCWEMRLSWIPFGPRTSYNFSINIKSSMLKDVLKYPRKNDFYDRF